MALQPNVPPTSEDSYGVHMLIDTKSIEEADKLLIECEKYIEETKSELFVIPFVPSFSLLANNVRAWRAKRKDSKLLTGYQALEPRIAALEKALRGIIGDVVEKKGALRLQARYLQVRLEECAKYNKSLLETTEIPLEETRNFVNLLSSESKMLKDMSTFNTELIKLQALESQSKHQIYGSRWVQGRQKAQNEVDVTKDIDHIAIQERLNALRELREKFVSFLASLLEKRGVQQSNMENCLWSMESLKSAIKREGVTEESIAEENGQKIDPLLQSFDHSRCTDCAYGYAMSCDCMSHLTALQKQVHDANKRLQDLVEIRERMRESYEAVVAAQENNNNTSRSSFTGSFSGSPQNDKSKNELKT